MNRTCLSLRIDIPTPHHLLLVQTHFISNKETYVSYIIYMETNPKDHLHIRIETKLTRQAIFNKLKVLYDELELKPSQHSHHVVWQHIKNELRPCKKHTDCSYGSFTYIAKNCKLMRKHNVSDELIKEIEHVGRQKLIESKMPVHHKIALLANLDCYSQDKDIVNAIRDYYASAGTSPPLNPKFMVHKLMCHIKWTKYLPNYYRTLLEEIQQYAYHYQ